MQPALNNNMNNMEKKATDAAWNTKSKIDRGLSELKDLASDTDFRALASDVTAKVRSVSGDVFRDSVSFVKRYPVGSAIGLAAAGFLIGVFAARSRD